MDIDIQSINVSWSFSDMTSSQIATRESWTYTLRLSSMTTGSVFQLSDTYHVFTAPDNTPPCEVYNFSVTATPVGATTYTGDGCSAPGPMLSRMLPSLPDIDKLESSLNYSPIKAVNKAGTVTVLTATFIVSRILIQFCVYTLKI